MHSFIRAWAKFVVERRWLVILFGLVTLVLLMIPTRGLYFDNSNEMWFVQGDPALKEYDQLLELFGDNEYLLVGLEARKGDRDLFTPEAFRILYKLTEFLENHEHVTKVQSLSKYQRTVSVDGMMEVENLVAEYQEDFDASPEAMERARSIMKGEDLVLGQLITADLRHTNVSARVEHIPASIDHHVKLTQELRAFIEKEGLEGSGFKVRVTGTPAINEGFLSASMADFGFTMPLMMFLIVLFLVLSFRTLGGVMLPMLVIVGSVLYAVGLLGAMGWAFNMLNVNLPVILMAVGIGDSVHILNEFYHFRNRGEEAKEAAIRATEELFVPCLNTSITTALGFLAISVSRLKPLAEFGVIAAAGVFFAFLLSVTVMPALLSFSRGKVERARQIAEDGRIARLTRGLSDEVFAHRKIILAVAAMVGAFMLVSAKDIQIDSNFVNFFKSDHPMKKDLDYFTETFNGGAFLEYVFDSGRPMTEEASGGTLEPEFLARVKSFQSWLETHAESGKTTSMVQMVEKMNQTMHDDNPLFNHLPETRQQVAQYLLLYSNAGPSEDLSDLKSFDERYLRVSQRLTQMSSAKMDEYMKRVGAELERNYADLNVKITGVPVLYTNMDTYILAGIVDSMSIAVLSIAICFFVLLRSFKYGILALIPSLYPILLSAGLMGVLGVELNFTSMIIASITLGIAVDDAIHILTRYIRARKGGSDRLESVRRAVTETGRALVYTTLILYVGFSILMLSTFVPSIHMGFFAGVILMLALVASLTILPAVIFLGGKGNPKSETNQIQD